MQSGYSGGRPPQGSYPRGSQPARRHPSSGGPRPGSRPSSGRQPHPADSSRRQSNVRAIREKPPKATLPKMGRIDISFFFLVITLVSIGLVMSFSASYAISLHEEGSSLKIILKQLIFTAVGFAGMLVASYVPYTVYRKLAKLIYFGCLGLMALALLFPNDDGARRWIRFGSFTFQPSELLKFGLVVLLSSLIVDNYKRMHTAKYGVGLFIVWLVPAVVLAIAQRHISGLFILMIIAAGMMYIGGTKLFWFLMLIPAGGALGIGYVMLKGFSYVETRFNSWVNPFENIRGDSWQICQSLYAIGSGGLTGVGLGNSTQKFLWVSEPQNDFIFAIVCEELGLLGAVAIILLFILFVCSGFSIAMRAPDRFSSMLVTGTILQFGVQALLNIAVVSNAMPTTGISLPFFSAGGSATVVQLCQMGVVLGVSRYCRPTIAKQPDPEANGEAPAKRSTPLKSR